MKVTGEAFSSHHKRKGAEEARYQKYQNFQAKGLLPDRTLESNIDAVSIGASIHTTTKWLEKKSIGHANAERR